MCEGRTDDGLTHPRMAMRERIWKQSEPLEPAPCLSFWRKSYLKIQTNNDDNEEDEGSANAQYPDEIRFTERHLPRSSTRVALVEIN